MADGYDAEREDYLSLADEMNDGPPHVGPWNEADWEPESVANAKRYAEKHGLPWPPGTGDYERWFELASGLDDLPELAVQLLEPSDA